MHTHQNPEAGGHHLVCDPTRECRLISVVSSWERISYVESLFFIFFHYSLTAPTSLRASTGHHARKNANSAVSRETLGTGLDSEDLQKPTWRCPTHVGNSEDEQCTRIVGIGHPYLKMQSAEGWSLTNFGVWFCLAKLTRRGAKTFYSS